MGSELFFKPNFDSQLEFKALEDVKCIGIKVNEFNEFLDVFLIIFILLKKTINKEYEKKKRKFFKMQNFTQDWINSKLVNLSSSASHVSLLKNECIFYKIIK